MGINKDIALCVPRLQQAWAYLKEEWPKRYPDAPAVILVETYRSPDVQRAYYAQGREKLSIVNTIRMKNGLEAITEVENRRKITNAPPGKSLHQVSPSRAFDLGFVKGGKMDWSEANYENAAHIIREKFPDVTWGADWNKNWKTSDEKFIDMPHFQV
ncbi:M15 family metallopeptidase [Spirosoma lituiforme]